MKKQSLIVQRYVIMDRVYMSPNVDDVAYKEINESGRWPLTKNDLKRLFPEYMSTFGIKTKKQYIEEHYLRDMKYAKTKPVYLNVKLQY